MKGLLLKDLYNLKKQGKFYLLLTVLYGIVFLKDSYNFFFGALLFLLMAFLPVTASAYDERSSWNRYALTMPLSRKDLAGSKYLLGLLGTSGMLVFLLLLALFFRERASFTETSLLLFFFFFSSQLIMSILLPLIFRFGVEKSRLLLILLMALPMGAVSVALISPGGGGFANPQVFPAVSLSALFLSAAVTLPAVFVSFRISAAICARKEF